MQADQAELAAIRQEASTPTAALVAAALADMLAQAVRVRATQTRAFHPLLVRAAAAAAAVRAPAPQVIGATTRAAAAAESEFLGKAQTAMLEENSLAAAAGLAEQAAAQATPTQTTLAAPTAAAPAAAGFTPSHPQAIQAAALFELFGPETRAHSLQPTWVTTDEIFYSNE
jgi:hypothetical protein